MSSGARGTPYCNEARNITPSTGVFALFVVVVVFLGAEICGSCKTRHVFFSLQLTWAPIANRRAHIKRDDA